MIDINKHLEDELNRIDLSEVVSEEIRKLINKDIRSQILKIVNSKLELLITSEINNELSGKVMTDDGWGARKTYDSFEALFKATLVEKMNGAYSMKETISRCVKARVDKLFSDKAGDISKKFADELMKEGEK
jgi:hypothetical protein